MLGSLYRDQGGKGMQKYLISEIFQKNQEFSVFEVPRKKSEILRLIRNVLKIVLVNLN